MTNRALTRVTDIHLGTSERTSSISGSRSIKCINNKPTSAKVRCTLSTNIIHLRSLNSIFIDMSPYNFRGINSEIKLNFNSDYLLSDTMNNINQLLLLNVQSTWYMNENTIDSHDLNSDKIAHSNVLDAIINPSTCFDMTMNETIHKYQVSFSAIAKMAVYSNSGNRYVGTQLSGINNGIGSDATIFDNKLIQIPITGYLDVNIIGAENNDITPCLENN